MPIHDHEPNPRGRAAVWAGAGFGLVFLIALLTHGFGLFGHHAGGDGIPPALVRKGEQIIVPDGSPLRARLTVLPASAEPVHPRLALPAVAEADPARTANVLAPLGGRLGALKVALGDHVVQGQELAVIDSPDLAQAYDDDDKAAAALHLASRTLQRQIEQQKIGAASDQSIDQARSDEAQARAEHERTQSRLRAIGAEGRNVPARRLIVRAPVAGSITSLAVAPGTMINDPTQPIMTVADLSTIWVTAMVAEADLGFVAKGQDADVEFVAHPGEVLHGKVLFVADVVDPDTRRTRVRIALANAGYAIKPNMYATVTLAAAANTRVTLPSSALLMNNDRTSVFVATAPWTFERRTVELDLEEGTTVTIRAGVKAGDQVVVRGGILLND